MDRVEIDRVRKRVDIYRVEIDRTEIDRVRKRIEIDSKK